jgi:2,4-dienoyl-CoA reductase-like NADH-dependent reductase (Old Yellow Enzyme family)
MSLRHEPFSFKSGAELLKKADELGIGLPFQDSVAPLFEGVPIGWKKVPNRMAVQPMEGFDAEADGSPGELTIRRYKRYAEGGSGLIWFEATSIVPQGRSNPHQLLLEPRTLDEFKRLVEQTRRSAYRIFGALHEIFLVLQLTHSGRYSKPAGKAEPLVAGHIPLFESQADKEHVASDEELDRLLDKFVLAARLAQEAGFDAVDIKACHGYLVNELLSARTRTNSRYGGNFENRSRFLRKAIQNIKEEASGVYAAVRLSAFDGIPYPYGFGTGKSEPPQLNLSEPKELIRRLIQAGCLIFNITVGNPYLYPHLGRPFDRALPGATLPDEHPLESVSRLLRITAELQKMFPKMTFVGTGYSWLRNFLPHVAAAVIERREATLIGLGRSSLAYPDAPKDLMAKGAMDPSKVCITCSRCTELMRSGHSSGCAVRDKEVYGKEYKRFLGDIENG